MFIYFVVIYSFSFFRKISTRKLINQTHICLLFLGSKFDRKVFYLSGKFFLGFLTYSLNTQEKTIKKPKKLKNLKKIKLLKNIYVFFYYTYVMKLLQNFLLAIINIMRYVPKFHSEL